MSKRSLISLIAAAVLVATAVILGCTGVFARYLEMLTGDQAFTAKPLDALEINQQWVQVDDTYVLTFTAGQQAKNCRVYLAASEGVTNAESLQVELTVSADAQTLPDAEQETPAEPQILQATPAAITEGSAIYNLFGPGTVFRFQDAETQEERTFDLSENTYTITVRGLESAAELSSLLRLFVEFVPE